jgi:hypothetical protein
MELLTQDYADRHGLNVVDFRREYYARLKYEEPRCRVCGEVAR